MSTSQSTGMTRMTRSVTRKGTLQPGEQVIDISTGSTSTAFQDIDPFKKPYNPPPATNKDDEGFETVQSKNKKAKKEDTVTQKQKEVMKEVAQATLGRKQSQQSETAAANESRDNNHPIQPNLTKNITPMDLDQNNDDHNAGDETNEIPDDEDDIIDIAIMAEKPQFKVYFDLAQIPGKSHIGKVNLVKKLLAQHHIACFPGRIDAKNIEIDGNIQKQHYYVFKCANETAFEKILREPIPTKIKIKQQDGKIVEQDLNVTFNKIEKKEIPAETQQNIDEHTIFVNKIPAELRNYQIKGVFGTYGNIVNFKTFMRGQYQNAIITFDDKSAVQPFYYTWGIFINQHLVRVRPKVMSEDKLHERTAYYIKLAGLPLNTSAFDLRGFMERYNVKYLDIPRNSRFNYPLRYCFVYFQNEEDFQIATKQAFCFKEHQLYWTDVDMKTCHRCGSPEHLAMHCDHEDNRPRYKNRKEVLKGFRQARQERDKKYGSYAQAAQQGRNRRQSFNSRRPWNRANLSHDNKSHDQNNVFSIDKPKHQRQMSMTKNTIQDRNVAFTITKAMEKLDQLCKNFTVLQNEQRSISNELKSIKVKQNTKDTTKPNTTVNKAVGSSTKGVTRNNNKRILLEESSDDSTHELSDLEERFKQSEQKSQNMATELTDLKGTMQKLLQLFQSSNDNHNVEGDNTYDEEIIDISQ
ncbi:uncharacterized protein OCT59_003520 [Rhizophagus irregularis]|uniref:uncharacterized protein n=1 Tax=Rhizophagus irregularis TaxID=588596 RepID=UPI000CC9A40A|nr:hypothetical protein OCT59_003520 [Rhizophagus irregularis]